MARYRKMRETSKGAIIPIGVRGKQAPAQIGANLFGTGKRVYAG